MAGTADRRGGAAPVADVAGSASGWSGIQLAVLAFIGFCGVVTDARPDLPGWLQATAGLLAGWGRSSPSPPSR